jgi:Uma2 family endonuclease
MGAHAPREMSVDEFYAWGELQEDRYEYVDGFPVRMMSGASRRHDQVVVNVLVSLGNQLRGGPCRPFTADTAVATMPRRRRRPDVGIECGERRDADYQAGQVRLVVEVLSPRRASSISTGSWTDTAAWTTSTTSF